MGLTQTGGHSESEGCSEAEEANESESWREGPNEGTAGVISSDDAGSAVEEMEEQTEDQQKVFSLAFLGGVRVGCEEVINRNGAPKLATVHEGRKPEKNNSRQKEETVVGDGGSEREGERGTEMGGGGGGVPVRDETEAGNHGEHDNDSAESPCETKGQAPQPKTTGVTISQSGAIMEIPQDRPSLSDVCMKRTVERFSQSNMEMGRSEEHSSQSEPKLEIREENLSKSDLPIERKEECFSHTDWLKETSNEYFTLSESKEPDLMAGSTKVVQIPLSLSALLVDDEKLPDELGLMTGHGKYIQSSFFDCDVTSCSSTTETSPENGEASRTFAVSAAAANLRSDSTAEAFHLPEDSWRTTFKQEVSPSNEQDQGMLLANGTLSLVVCHRPLSGLNLESDIWREESGTALNAVSHTQLLPNQDRAEALKQESSKISQGDTQGVCTGSGANQEIKGTDSGSQVTEIDTGGSNARSDNCFDATIQEAEVIVTDIDGCGAQSDDQREESTVELEVTKQVAGGCDVQSEWDRWESLLGLQVKSITGGNDVHSDSCTGGTTLESEVVETVIGGSDVQSEHGVEGTSLESEVMETVTGGSDVQTEHAREGTSPESEVLETVIGGSDVQSEHAREGTSLESEVMETVIGGGDVQSEHAREGTSLESEVMETVIGGGDVQSEHAREGTSLESEVMETVIGGGDVRSEHAREGTSLESEVMETVIGGGDVRSEHAREGTSLESEVMETVIGGGDVRSEHAREGTSLESEVMERVLAGIDMHSNSCTEQAMWEGEVDMLEHESATPMTSDLEVVSLCNMSTGATGCPSEGKETVRDLKVALSCDPKEELRCVDNELSTLQVPHHHQAAPDTAPESTVPVSSHSIQCYGPSLAPVRELSLREEEYGDVGESMRNISELRKGDVSVVEQEVCERKVPSDLGKDAEGEQIHSENDSVHPSQLWMYQPWKEKLTLDPPESSLSLALWSTGTCGSGAPQGSGSDSDGVFTTDAEEYGVLPKVMVVSMAGSSASKLLVSSSPNENTATLVLPGCSPDWSCAEAQIPGRTAVGDEEVQHHVTEVPAEPSFLRCPARCPSPFLRHSWGPGKNPEREAGITQCWFSGGLVKASLPKFQRRSYSLEELAKDDGVSDWPKQRESAPNPGLTSHRRSEERGSVLSLTEELLGERSNSLSRQISAVFRSKRRTHGSVTLPLTKSVSLLAINQRDLDGMGSFPSISASSAHSISEEAPGAPRVSEDGKRANKVGRTFSYLRSKMYKKSKEKEKKRVKEGERDVKEEEEQSLNGHLFSAFSPCSFLQCHRCHKAITAQQAFKCTTCNAHVHKACRDILPTCTRTKMKLLKMHFAPPDSAVLRSKCAVLRQQLWAEPAADRDASRRLSGIRPFSNTNLSKSISISNIAGPVSEEIPLRSLRYLSQSTDSLNTTVNMFMESLTDEETEMMDGRLLGEFEAEAQALEAESWTFTVDRKFLRQLRKDVIKRQDAIYELMRTEMHHLRSLRVLAEVYRRGMLTEVPLEPQAAERIFPALDELLQVHSGFLTRLLELKRQASESGAFLIHNIGDVLITQFSGSTAQRMKTVYGKFCSHHKEALNFYKELYAKDKRFQAFIMRKMSSPVVRRQGIPEFILLVTQRITKYPVLLQRLLQHTKEGGQECAAVTQALLLVRQLISAVNRMVEQHELGQRLREVYSRTDARSVMRMQSGEMFAREDLLRGRTLLHHGPLQLRTSTGRLKEALALLLSDVLIFLQEKDLKYIFASLDQGCTVLSLQKLIVREVANEERGLFLIAAGVERPEMVEVLAASREERSAWIQLIQEAVSSMDRCEDEGESVGDRRLLQVKEMRDQLHRKQQQITALLMEKLRIFQEMAGDSRSGGAAVFRAHTEDTSTGELTLRDVLREVESLQTLLHCGLGETLDPLAITGAPCFPSSSETNQIDSSSDSEDSPVSHTTINPECSNAQSDGGGSLPHQQTTEICSTLKKQVLHSVCHLQELLSELQTLVLQQDSIVEEQRITLNQRPPSSSPASSRRTSSLVEQERQRSLQRQRQEAADLRRQQEAHAAERLRRESEWTEREQELRERETRLLQLDKETQRGLGEVQREREELRCLKEAHQRDVERLTEVQRRLERDKEQLKREQRVGEKSRSRAPSCASEDSLQIPSPMERKLSSSPIRDALLRMGSLRRGRNLNPVSSNDSRNAPDGEGQSHRPIRLLQLAKTKQPKEKKKNEKEQRQQATGATVPPGSEQPEDRKIVLC